MKQIKIMINKELDDKYPDGAYLKINGAIYFYEHNIDMTPSEKENEHVFAVIFQQFRNNRSQEYSTVLFDYDIATYCVKRFIDFGYIAHHRGTDDNRYMIHVMKPGIGITEGRSI